jgi:drug/metabolite transporter, DME family
VTVAPPRFVPTVAVVAAAMLFGTTGTAQELGPDGTTPLGVGTLRIVVGAGALWCFARTRPSWAELARHRWLFMLGAVGVAAYQPAFFTGTSRSGVALGTVVALGSGPVFAGLIEWIWLSRRPTGRWLAATAVMVLGGALLVFAGEAGATVDAVGVLGSLAAGFGYAVYAIAAKLLIDRGVDSTVSLAWPFSIGALLLVPFALGEPLAWALTAEGALMLVHLGVLTVGLAYFLYGWGLRTLSSSTAVTLTLAEPLTASIVAVVVLDERLRPAGWLGAALVVVGLAAVGGVRLRPWRRTRF